MLKGDEAGPSRLRRLIWGSAADPYHLTLADLNADGRFGNVAVAVYGNSYLDVFMNRVTAPSVTWVATRFLSSHPIGVATGDVNADGVKDLVVALYNGDRLGVWLATR